MTEPTKEAIAEASVLADTFGMDCGGYFQFTENDVARLIAHVRKKARDDALERAAKHFEGLTARWPLTYCDEAAAGIRAMKDQPSGEA